MKFIIWKSRYDATWRAYWGGYDDIGHYKLTPILSAGSFDMVCSALRSWSPPFAPRTTIKKGA